MGTEARARFGAFSLDSREGRLYRDGVPLPIRPKSFAVLEYLVVRPGTLVRKEELLEAVWSGTSVSDTVLKVCIRELRAALNDDPRSPKFIETAHRRGYRFLADVRQRSLPTSLTSFVGRERELVAIGTLFGNARLLTLVGAGGCGKTRLALELVRSLEAEARDEAYWVDLVGASERLSVLSTIAAACGAREQPEAELEDVLARRLGGRERILVLDNCEHVVDAVASSVDRLLRSTDELRVLATSREPLKVDGERIFVVSPLTMDESSRLFLARAEAVRPGAASSEADLDWIVSQICHRLDGIPLAIELAAARLTALTPGVLLERLDDRFRALGEAGRSAAARHRTLQAAIAWSFQLLTEEEQRLFRRLAVFPGSFALASAESIASDEFLPSSRVLALLTRLVEKSLVQLEPDGRYRLLESVRLFGRERLSESGELGATRDRHLGHFLAMAQRVEPRLLGGERLEALAELRDERGNLDSALTAAMESENEERALAFGASLAWFWFFDGRWSEGRSWLGRILQRSASRPLRTRSACLLGRGILAWTSGRAEEAAALLDESSRLFRESEDANGLAMALQFRGMTFLGTGDLEAARRTTEEAVAHARRTSPPGFELTTSLASLGIVALAERRHREARRFLAESVALARGANDDWALALPLRNLGIVAFREDRLEEARTLLRESLRVQARLSEKWFLSRSLEMLASVLSVLGDYERAARLYGSGEALRRELGAPVLPLYFCDYERGVAKLQEALSPEELESVWAEGRALSPEEAIALGLS